ncbi:MAG: MerR family transcriptional regulator [Myxococcota bacterium]|nr:MerR family transcriptional regulator [Myxococcota bacterium]
MTSRLTGIELDTLRMWERRYGFPKPERSEGGSRVYSDADVESLKLISRALELGHRPGEVVGKPRHHLMKLVGATSPGLPTMTGPVATVDSLVTAIGRDDIGAVRAELRQAAVVLGARRFVMDIAQPIALRVGELWGEGKLEVRHEHMLSECLSSQLRVLMSAYEEREAAPRVLLATLPNERHGLGLEMIEVYLAVNQITPRLLGVDTPAEQIVKAARSQAVDAVGVCVAGASDLKATARHLQWMLAELPRRVPIWIGGVAVAQLELRDDAVRVIATWIDLDAAIAALRTARN